MGGVGSPAGLSGSDLKPVNEIKGGAWVAPADHTPEGDLAAQAGGRSEGSVGPTRAALGRTTPGSAGWTAKQGGWTRGLPVDAACRLPGEKPAGGGFATPRIHTLSVPEEPVKGVGWQIRAAGSRGPPSTPINA